MTDDIDTEEAAAELIAFDRAVGEGYAVGYQDRAAGEVDPSAPMAFVFSSEMQASDGDIIEAKSWNLRRYVRNPVVLDGHNVDRVVGRAVDVRKVLDETRKGQPWRYLAGSIVFDLADPEAARIAGQHARGFRSAVSVRWRPGELVPRSTLPVDHVWYAAAAMGPWGVPVESYVHKRAELLEVSSVSIPADAEALQQRARAAARAAVAAAATEPDRAARADMLTAVRTALADAEALDTPEIAETIARLLVRISELPTEGGASARDCLRAIVGAEPARVRVAEDSADMWAADVLYHFRRLTA
jgi:hypothetical protein